MAAFNLTVRKGKCINFGQCKNADTKEIIEVNLGDEFVCPDCGGMLVEEKKRATPKWIFYAAIALPLIGAIVFFTIKPKVNHTPTGGNVVDSLNINKPLDPQKEKIKLLISEADMMFSNKEYEKSKLKYQNILAFDPGNEYAINQLVAIQKAMLPPPPQGPGDKGTVKHATVKNDSVVYEGEKLNGLPNGQGNMYFKKRQIINPNDPEMRYAEEGEYVIGLFHNGYLVNGRLYGINKKQKSSLYIGQ